MTKKQIFNIIYALFLTAIIILFIIYPGIDDVIMFILASVAIVLTSIFTYSNRRKR